MIPEAQKQQMAEAVAKIRETMAAAARAAGRAVDVSADDFEDGADGQ